MIHVYKERVRDIKHHKVYKERVRDIKHRDIQGKGKGYQAS